MTSGPRIAGTSFLLLALAVLPALLRPAAFFKDDAYFYLQVAGNIVEGLGSTFHGLTQTNGYHPLWMAGAVPAMWLAGGDRALALHVVVAIQAVLLLGIALLFLRFARSMSLGLPVVGLVVVLGYLLGTGIYGSEAHLNGLLLTAGLLALWRTLPDSRWQSWFLTGVVFGLSLLARLDNIFVVVALCSFGLLHATGRQLRPLIASTLAVGVGGLVTVAPYLAWNLVEFGHLTPISGAIKSTFPVFSPELARLGSMGKIALLAGLLSLLVGGFLDHDRRRRVIWLGLGAGVVLHAAYVIGFTDHYTFWVWYYVSGVLAAGLVTAYLAGRVASLVGSAFRGLDAGAVIAAVALALLLAITARAWLKAFGPVQAGPVTIEWSTSEYRWADEFGDWMGRNLPQGSRILAYDWPGALAYYSGLVVLAEDGLVSDFAYNDDLLAEGVPGYFCARGVSYYFGLLEPDSTTRYVEIKAPLYRQAAGKLLLREDAIVVKVRDVVRRPDEALPFAIWRLQCAPPSG